MVDIFSGTVWNGSTWLDSWYEQVTGDIIAPPRRSERLTLILSPKDYELAQQGFMGIYNDLFHRSMKATEDFYRRIEIGEVDATNLGWFQKESRLVDHRDPYFEYLFANTRESPNAVDPETGLYTLYEKSDSPELIDDTASVSSTPERIRLSVFGICSNPVFVSGKPINTVEQAVEFVEPQAAIAAQSTYVGANTEVDQLNVTTGLNIDITPFSQHFFNQAGIALTTRNIVDNHVAAQGTGLQAAHLEIDERHEMEKEKATKAFFGNLDGTSSQELLPALGPSSDGYVYDNQASSLPEDEPTKIRAIDDKLFDVDYYLAPTVYQPSAYVASQAASPHPASMVQNSLHQIVAKSNASGVSAYLLPPTVYKPAVVGKSLTHGSAGYAITQAENQSSIGVKPYTSAMDPSNRPISSSSSIEIVGVNPRISSSSSIEIIGTKRHINSISSVAIISVKKKRSARDSFVTKSTCDPDNVDAFQHPNTKRARIENTEVTGDVHGFCPPSPTISLISVESACEAKEALRKSCATTSTRIISYNKPVGVAPKGFAGQFQLPSDISSSSSLQKSYNRCKFGDRLHPNGEFINTAFELDARCGTRDFTRDNMPSGDPLHHIILYADAQTDLAVEQSYLRNKVEARLRYEAHIECASARLEGCAVGYYRYFQGHLSLEEYLQAGLCICWDTCKCTKLCTRYGDVRCPCSDDIILEED